MNPTTILRAVLAMAAAVLLGGTMLAAIPSASATAPAAPAAATLRAQDVAGERAACRRTCFGAISVNPKTGSAHSAYNYSTKSAAIRKAQNACKNKNPGDAGACRKAGWFRNACGAVAYRINNGVLQEWGFAWAEREGAAVDKAKRKVRGPGNEKKWISACTAN